MVKSGYIRAAIGNRIDRKIFSGKKKSKDKLSLHDLLNTLSQVEARNHVTIDIPHLFSKINDLKVKLSRHNSLTTSIERELYIRIRRKGIRITKVSKRGVYYTFYEIVNQIINEFLFTKSNSIEKILRYSIPERHDEHDYLILGGFTIAKGTKNERDRVLAIMKKVLSNKVVVKELSHLKSSRRNISAEVD
jgi:hypothetical protein